MKIVFCHNVHVRYKTLFETIKTEKLLFPDSHSIVAYNDEPPPEYIKVFNDVEFHHYHGKTHKIGCANGCIVSIQEALKYNPDVIVFSHDDVMINEDNLDVFNKNVKIVTDYMDVVCRRPGDNLYGKNYFMMECFFISRHAALECFKNLTLFENEFDIPRDGRGSVSPEVFLYETLSNFGIKLKVISYEHKLEGYNETLQSLMGFTHVNAGIRGWQD